MPPCGVDDNVRKNLIVENVPRTNDVNVTSEMRPNSPPVNTVNCTEQRLLTPGRYEAGIRTLTCPRLQMEVCNPRYGVVMFSVASVCVSVCVCLSFYV